MVEKSEIINAWPRVAPSPEDNALRAERKHAQTEPTATIF